MATRSPSRSTLSTNANCSISGAAVTFVAVGTCVIDANQAGNANYAAATQVQQSVDPEPGTQSITFTSTPPNSEVVGGTYMVTASGGASGNPVTFSIDASTNAICSISGATVTFLAVGTCAIDANQAGNANYAAATQVQQSVDPEPIAQSIAFTSTPPNPAVVGGGTYTVTASGGSGNPITFSIDASANGSCGISGTTVTLVAVGTCVIDANQGGNANYAAATQVQQSFAVLGTQNITFTSTPPNPALVGGSTYTVTASGGASGNPVTFSIDPSAKGSCSISGTTITFVGVGTCVIDANQGGNANYAAATQVQQSFAVLGIQSITFTSTPPNSGVVGGSTYTVTASGGASGNPVTFSIDPSAKGSCRSRGTTVTFVAVGTCVIDANQAGSASYEGATPVQQSFAVLGIQSITFTSTPPNPALVGGSTYTLTASGGASGNPVTFSIGASANGSCSISGTTVTFVAAGTCVIDANQAGDANYEAATQAQQSFAVTSSGSPTSSSSGTVVCGQAILQSPYSYDGSATSFTSGQYGLPTFGSAGTDFPNDTAGVIVPAGNNTALITSYELIAPHTIYYWEPGVHTTGGHGTFGGTDIVYLGGYTSALGEATVDGNGGSGFLESNQGATGGIVEYLTIENFLSDQNSAVLGENNGSGGSIAIGWTYEYDTVGPNEFGPSGSGQNSDGGYGIIGGSNTTIEYDCLTENAQGAFNIPGGPSATTRPPTFLTGDVLSHNEISGNGLGAYPDIPGNPHLVAARAAARHFGPSTCRSPTTTSTTTTTPGSGWTSTMPVRTSQATMSVPTGAGAFTTRPATTPTSATTPWWATGGRAMAAGRPRATARPLTRPTIALTVKDPVQSTGAMESAGAILVVGSGGNANIAGSNYSGEVPLRTT